MDAEIKPEDYLSMTAAAKVTPGRPGVHVFYRWMEKGIPLPDGTVLKLRHIRVGGKILTTKAWLDEFIIKNTTAHQNVVKPMRTKTARRVSSRRIQRQNEYAARELAKR